jgi:hypothetical protein
MHADLKVFALTTLHTQIQLLCDMHADVNVFALTHTSHTGPAAV